MPAVRRATSQKRDKWPIPGYFGQCQNTNPHYTSPLKWPSRLFDKFFYPSISSFETRGLRPEPGRYPPFLGFAFFSIISTSGITCGGITFVVQFPARTSSGDLGGCRMTKQFWLDSAWHSPWATTKALIRTHNRWLTVFGAAIVFALFIVKDAYRESAKEMASLLSQAQSTFINGRNIHLI